MPAADYVDAAVGLLGGEDTDFLVKGTQGGSVQLCCGKCDRWGYLIGEIPLWELVADARAHWDKEHT